MSKVRIYDLAKELKLDNKKVIEEVRRFGYDVSVPSNSVPPDIAEKVKSKYFPQKTQAERRVKLVKHRNDENDGIPLTVEETFVELPKVIESQKPVIEKTETETINVETKSPEVRVPEVKPIEVRPPSVVKVVKKVETPAVPATTVVPPPVIEKPSPDVRESEEAAKPRIVKIEPPRVEQPAVVQPQPALVAPPQPLPVQPETKPALAKVETKPISVPTPVQDPKPAVQPAVNKSTPAAASPAPASSTGVRTQIIPLQPPPPAPPQPQPQPQQRTHHQGQGQGQQQPRNQQPHQQQHQQGRPQGQGQPQRRDGDRDRGGDRFRQGQQGQGQPYQQRPQHQGGQQGQGQPYQQRPQHQGGQQGQGQPYQQRPPYQGQQQHPRNQGGVPPQKLVSKPMTQVLHRVTAQPEGEALEGQRTTYIPPPDTRKKGRRSGGGNARPLHVKKEDREKLPSLQHPIAAAAVPKVVVPKELKPIKLVEGSTVKEFAEKLEVKPKDVVALLLSKGVMATINQILNADVAREIGREFGFEVSYADFEEMTANAEIEDIIDQGEEDELETRAPVVTVMGHVDHGKTSLLDAIRKTRVAEGEAGGITQHIGAYSVNVADPDHPERKRRVVFLDTPGHEAFTMMRARGAKATDVVILVVAADDGVMPQTIEAIEHAKAAGVPIVVAINKIDKPAAQPDRVKQALSDYGLVWDGWGGETVMVEVSAKQRINLNSLLEMILLTADILDLKASPKRLGSGVVLEAKLDKGRGAVATVLVQNGTLKVGDPVIAGLFFGRVRAMHDDRLQIVTEVGPASPVEVLGLQGVPSAGDPFQVVTDVAKAQQISMLRQSKKRMLELSRSSAQRLEDLFSAMQAGKLKELLVILKTDVQGSVEVLKDTLQKLSTDKVKVRVIRSGVGAITESDVLLATASNDMAHSAVIIGFNVRPELRAEELARLENVDIRLHSIIYKIEEEIRNAMLGMLEATIKEVPLGKAEIRQLIKIPKIGNIAGVMVIDGIIKRTAKARLVRDGAVIHEGNISSLRRFKDDVSEVKQGFECGIGIEKYSDIKLGDIIEVFTTEKVVPTEL